MATTEQEDVCLLFFDTFYHQTSEEGINLDLIQFTQPVVVYELRIIPLRTQVETNLGKGCRFGGTLPSEFELQVFVNNLDKPNASTFEKLGQLEYKENKNIQLKMDRLVPTDGIILKGDYRTVTLAVYGCLTVVMPQRDSPPPPPPPLPGYPTSQSKSKIPGLDINEDDTHKSVPQQQHPLDFINEQVQKRQQQLYSSTSSSSSSAQSLTRDSHKPAALEDSFVEVLRKPSPRRERDRGSSRDRASSRDRDGGSSRSQSSSHDSYDASREKDLHERSSRDYSFPPEPKEPYDSRDKDGRNDDGRSRPRDPDIGSRGSKNEDRPRSREQDKEREYGTRRDRMSHYDSRSSEGADNRQSHSREDSRESKEYKEDSSERDSIREDLLREREREMEREKERVRELEEREREQKEMEAREKEKREQEKLDREMKEREREMKEREREKELQRERDREKELQREKETRDREQREREKELDKERERERELKEKELEKEKEREIERERDREKTVRGKDRYDHDRPQRTRTPPKQSSLDGSRSRSNSRSRRGPRSRRRSRSRSKPRASPRHHSRSRSKEVDQRSEPPPVIHQPIAAEDEDIDEDDGVEDEEIDEHEIYDSMSDRVPSKRQQRPVYDADAQEAEEGYEDISSDDEMGTMEDPSMQVHDFYELEEDQLEGPQIFNPFDFFLTQTMVLKSPALSSYEIESSKYAGVDDNELERPKEAKTLMDIMYKFAEAEHQDRWVLAMEEIPALLDKGLSYILAHEKKQDVLNTLVSWVVEGCDPNIAMTQPDAAIKVRHLKIGIKLAGCLSVLNPNIALVLLRKGIQSKLLDLFESNFIVFSVKHLALRSLARTTHFPAGIQWFLGIHPEVVGKSKGESGYQRLVRSLLQPKIVKLTMSVTALLRKVHFFESLVNLFSIIERVLSSSTQGEEGNSQKEEEEEEPPQLQPEDEKKILANLDEVTKILADPHGLIGQLHDAVPYNLLVDNHERSLDTLQAVYNVADYGCLLESIFALICCPVTISCPCICLAIHTLLNQFMSTQEGLLYLLAHPETTSGIIRCLLQSGEEPEDSGEDFPSRQLGLELVFHLQIIQFVDQLFHFRTQSQRHGKGGTSYRSEGGNNKGPRVIDDPEVISVLHGLYSVTFTTTSRDPLIGRQIMAKVLGFDRNLEAFLPFLEKTGDEDTDNLMRKSVCANYCIQLLLTAIKTFPEVKMLDRYGHRLLAVCQDSTSTKLNQLQEWLTPVKKVTSFDLDGLPSMISQLKSYTDDVKKVPPGLITVIRMINSLVASAAANASVDNMDSLNEAKYRYAIVELYSADCFPIFINILQKLSESQLKVWQQGIPYTTDHWLTYFSLIKPTSA
uniref:Virilizer N-terminal domain-containing protein n=1 Tax=Arion vulgaris TaxID=1028688 RepID=A0A0B7AVR5_9EUPU